LGGGDGVSGKERNEKEKTHERMLKQVSWATEPT